MSCMWIEQVEFISFGDLSGKKIVFSKDRLNLVAEPDARRASAITEAIGAVLYTSDLSSRQSWKICLDVVYQRRSLRLVRDSSETTLRVLDRDKPDVDITREFVGASGQGEVGRTLTGMGKNLFERVCFVGKHKLDGTGLSEGEDLFLLLQSIADCFDFPTACSAGQALEEALVHFPYKGQKFEIDQLIGQLQQRYEQLRSLQYFQLCLQAAECDSRLLKAEEQLERMADLKQQLDRLSAFQDCSGERVAKVEELWSRRQLLRAQLEAAKTELESQESALVARDLENKERWGQLSGFTADDVQVLSSLAQTLQTAQKELSESKQRRDDELRRVKEEGVNLNDLSDVRRALLNLDVRDLDDAYAYRAMINSARDQISQCERSVWRARTILEQIRSEREVEHAKYKNMVLVLGFVSLIGFMVFLTVFLGSGLQMTNPFALGPLGGLFVLVSALVYYFLKLLQARKYKQKEFQEAGGEIDKQGAAGQELHSKIMGLEIRLEGLARKAGVAGGAEFVKHIEAYGTKATRLKDLDLLEQVLLSREAHVVKRAGELEAFFQDSGRKDEDIIPENALKLSQDITHYLEDESALRSYASVVSDKRAALGSLQEEISGLDRELQALLRDAKVDHPENLELAWQELLSNEAKCRQWESIAGELNDLEQESIEGIMTCELPGLIEKLKDQRAGIWLKIEDLVARYPDIPEASSLLESSPNLTKEIDRGQVKLGLCSDSQELTVCARTAKEKYDEGYSNLVEEKDNLEWDLDQIKMAKAVLTLAKDMFAGLSADTHFDLSGQLHELSAKVLKLYEVFAVTPQQFHLLIRMAVCQFFSQDVSLPIIVLKDGVSLEFLLGKVLRHHQVICVRGDQSGNQWLLDQMEPELRMLTKHCCLEPI